MKRLLIATTMLTSALCFVARSEDAPKKDAAPKVDPPAKVDAPAKADPPAKTDAAPKIKFEKDTYDFGTTSEVQSVTGIFKFENVGKADLKVEKPRPSCGCTVASMKPEGGLLKPGEKGELTLSVNVSHARGALNKTITVPSHDPDNATTVLNIVAVVKQALE